MIDSPVAIELIWIVNNKARAWVLANKSAGKTAGKSAGIIYVDAFGFIFPTSLWRAAVFGYVNPPML
jgi:hypothetical protein